MVLDIPPSELSGISQKMNDGQRFVCEIKPARKSKSRDQVSAIWGKIGEIADALFANKEDIYEECLRRYGQSVAMRVAKPALAELERLYRLVDVVQERDDGTVFVKAYMGLSEMNSAEASRLLEGVLDECAEMGLSREVKNG